MIDWTCIRHDTIFVSAPLTIYRKNQKIWYEYVSCSSILPGGAVNIAQVAGTEDMEYTASTFDLCIKFSSSDFDIQWSHVGSKRTNLHLIRLADFGCEISLWSMAAGEEVRKEKGLYS